MIALEVIRRGYALATFNRVELAPDNYRDERTVGLYRACPDLTFGALAAWAWGYHRCIDVLTSLDAIHPERIVATGHSRGGKTALLAGATDTRVAVTAPNNSGCAGAGCFRWTGPDCETLEDMLRIIPYWLGPEMKHYAQREHDLPFDQHGLKALVAPRALLTTEAYGDLWANPQGSWQTQRAAAEVYRFLGAARHIGTWYRDGGHGQGLGDWEVLLDFLDWQFQGVRPDRDYSENPYAELAAAHHWTAPPTQPRT